MMSLGKTALMHTPATCYPHAFCLAWLCHFGRHAIEVFFSAIIIRRSVSGIRGVSGLETLSGENCSQSALDTSDGMGAAEEPLCLRSLHGPDFMPTLGERLDILSLSVSTLCASQTACLFRSLVSVLSSFAQCVFFCPLLLDAHTEDIFNNVLVFLDCVAHCAACDQRAAVASGPCWIQSERE